MVDTINLQFISLVSLCWWKLPSSPTLCYFSIGSLSVTFLPCLPFLMAWNPSLYFRLFVKKILLHRQVASKTHYIQDQYEQNWVYLWRSLTTHSLLTDFNGVFLAVLSPTLKLFNYSMQTLGICSSSSYCQCHFLFSLRSIQVFFIIIILFWHSRFCMFCITLLPMLCVCLDASNPLDKCFMIRLFYLSHCWTLCCFRCHI